jgi:hypothetical protein
MGKATDYPKCKICGEAHRGTCYTRPSPTTLVQPVGKRFAAIDDPTLGGVTTEGKDLARAAKGVGITLPKPSSMASGKPAGKPMRAPGRPVSAKPKSPRAEYQRELMRKRRAEGKAK